MWFCRVVCTCCSLWTKDNLLFDWMIGTGVWVLKDFVYDVFLLAWWSRQLSWEGEKKGSQWYSLRGIYKVWSEGIWKHLKWITRELSSITDWNEQLLFCINKRIQNLRILKQHCLDGNSSFLLSLFSVLATGALHNTHLTISCWRNE